MFNPLARFRSFLAYLKDRPTHAFRRRHSDEWEYAQASSHTDWDAEERIDELREAMELRDGDPPGALKALLQLAEAGSVIAMVEVGEIYHWGRRTAANAAQAEAWLRRGYEQGSLRGLLSYGLLLQWEGDLRAAEAVFRRGVDKGFAPAMYRLARMLLDASPGAGARKEGRALLERAAAMGHPLARLRLGRALVRGRYGVRQIPRGFRMLWVYVEETVAAWDHREAVVASKASGETVH